MNNETFPSFSDEYASSSCTDDNTDSYSGSELGSEESTFSTDDDENENQPSKTIVQKTAKPKPKTASTEVPRSKLYNLLSALDDAVDVIVDAFIPIEDNDDKLHTESSYASRGSDSRLSPSKPVPKQKPNTSTSTRAPFVFRRKSSNNNQASATKLQKERSISSTILHEEDVQRTQSPKSPTESKKKGKSTARRPWSPKVFKKDTSPKKKHVDSRDQAEPVQAYDENTNASKSPISHFFSSPKSAQIREDDRKIETIQEDEEEFSTNKQKSPATKQKSPVRKFFASPKSKRGNASHEPLTVSIPAEQQKDERKDENGNFFLMPFEWISTPKIEEKEPEIVEVNPEEQPDKKGKKKFGRRRTKKASDSSDVSAMTMGKESSEKNWFRKSKLDHIDERDRAENGSSRKKNWKLRPFSPKTKSKVNVVDTREPEAPQEEQVQTEDENWWNDYFWPQTENATNKSGESVGNPDAEAELFEAESVKPRRLGRVLSRKSKKKVPIMSE
jgi:hypothetical protein